MIVIKQPAESRTFDLPMGLGEGRAVAAIEAVDTTARGLVAETAPLAAAIVGSSGQVVQLSISGGTDGEVYLIVVRVTDDAGDVVEADAELQVRDLAFVAPADGQATTYIEPSAYIFRYGLAETVQLTDEAGVGRIEPAALNAALADAAAEIDASLAVRFTTPLSPVPALVVMLAGDLTRERLHGISVPQAVKDAAAAARRNLAALAAGRITLPGATPIADGTINAPRFEQGSNRPFSDGALDGF